MAMLVRAAETWAMAVVLYIFVLTFAAGTGLFLLASPPVWLWALAWAVHPLILIDPGFGAFLPGIAVRLLFLLLLALAWLFRFAALASGWVRTAMEARL